MSTRENVRLIARCSFKFKWSFEAILKESRPQNPEFRIYHENFHPYKQYAQNDLTNFFKQFYLSKML